MKLSVVSALASVLAVTSALPASTPYLVHEKRLANSNQWKVRDVKLNPRTTLPIRVGLKQSNLERGHDFLMDVSHPSSPNYGKHWTPEQVAETFAPSQQSIDAVQTWLIDSGIEPSRISVSNGLNWVQFDATVDEAESLLHTQYKVFEHNSGKKHIACEDYSIPADLKAHIDFITPTVHFDVKVPSKPKSKSKKRNLVDKRRVAPTAQHEDPVPVTNLGSGTNVSYNLTNCYEFMTPECLRALYGFKEGTLAGSSYGIVEYTPQSYLKGDLDVFYSELASHIPNGTVPALDSIDGGAVFDDLDMDDYVEPSLDLQYAIGIVYPQKVTLYQVGDDVEGASFNNFLDALDASFCTYEGGDNSTQDSVYPDTEKGGYDHAENCGGFTSTSVISTSYAYNEADLGAVYAERQCHEYMKLGLAGVTVLYSSGDYGVAGNDGECCVEAACANGNYNKGSSGTFNPSFPATCPYITSVGATQMAGKKISDGETASSDFVSGGGFSNIFALPSYQASAIATYYSSQHAPTYTAKIYNNSQTVRGYPDVSANGINYLVAVQGDLYTVDGTSASAPVAGGIFNLINQERVKAGKTVVGFVNPVLYENPGAFTDITEGDNAGCGTNGFAAVDGWDPLTGLGTPDYDALLAVFLALD